MDFDYTIAVSRIASQSALSPAEVEQFFFHSPLLVDYESGRLTRQEFFEQARQATGFRGTMEEFGGFFADIFTEIPPMIELQAELRRRNIPTYIFPIPMTWPSNISAGISHSSEILTATFIPTRWAR